MMGDRSDSRGILRASGMTNPLRLSKNSHMPGNFRHTMNSGRNLETFSNDMPVVAKRGFCRKLSQICCRFKFESQEELIKNYFRKRKDHPGGNFDIEIENMD